MIKASYEDDKGIRHYVFGLSDKNVMNLTRNRPIKFDLNEVGGQGTVVIFHGEDEFTMEKMMRDAGLIQEPDTTVRRKLEDEDQQ